jgi:hypothetical protein
MKLALFVVTTVSLAAAIDAQRARNVRGEPAFVASEHLYELETTPENRGARALGDLDGDLTS